MPLATSLGCASRPAGRLVVDQVELKGARQVDAGDVLDKLATRPSSTLLGVPHSAGFLSVPLEYEVYDPFVVERDVQRVERFYRARGYYEARVLAARVVRLPGDRVRVELHVYEGSAVQVGRVRVRLRGPISREASAELAVALKALPEKTRFDEQAYDTLKQDVLRSLTDHGYAHAAVEGGFETSDLVPYGGNERPLPAGTPPPERGADEPDEGGGGEAGEAGTAGAAGGEGRGRRYGVRIDPAGRRADVFLTVDPGPPSAFGAIRIEGLEGMPEDRIRATINLREGAEYSTAELEEARHALLALSVFSAVEYEADLGKKGAKPRVIPVTFRLSPAPLHTSTLGGGMRTDSVQTDVHLVAGYEHANFLGGLRRLTLQARPGVVLYPITTQNVELAPPDKYLFQMQARAELRQPSFIEARTGGIARIEGLLRPFFLPRTGGATSSRDEVLGFYEFRGALGVDRAFFDNHFLLGLSYNLQTSVPFAYCGVAGIFCQRQTINDDLVVLVVPYVSFTQAVDLRDDPIHPRKGIYFLNDFQWADNRFAGGVKVADLRVQPDLRAYVPLNRYTTLALRTSVGFALPLSSSYARPGDLAEADPDPLKRASDLQLLFLRGFFSGGPNSNRGYPTGGVGRLGIPPRALGQFFIDEKCYADGLTQPRGGYDIDCFLPLGGLSLWEASLELRIQLSDTVSFVPFIDASDVTRKRGGFSLARPHPSIGLGLRITTPIGPLRLDGGYAMPPTAFGVPAWRDWGVRPDLLGLGAPIALNIAFGEAF